MTGAEGSSPKRTADFLDSLGVVTHVNSYPYDSPERIDRMLDYMGITNIRQNSPINAQSELDLAELGRLGAKIDLLINGNGPVQLHYATDAIAKFLPWLNAVELPNEVDIFPISYDGLTGMTGGDEVPTGRLRGGSLRPSLQACSISTASRSAAPARILP